ncbi:SDR family oxidoreductase [Chitinophaga sp. CF418]|uniref:SDR family oxidoreductase n=1 Tax=Chitinophaga sp. CF418 TaxID=1855287 RepID=UPI0009237305|nr:SDR family oxidoreductase [Chitinophaga sp. CF418]SHN38698.1 Short-chain dehydrogenase [Chitinophaga sp. CF418]
MENQIAGKVIVITGASSGAGRTIALHLAQDGAFPVLASRNEAALEELATECRDLGTKALVVPTDVTDHSSVRHLARAAFEWKGRIDVWVNNAGVLAAGAFEKMPWENHQRVIATNLLGYMSGAHAVLPYFKYQQRGILINNISIGGFLPVPFGGAYSASKFALRGFFEALKGELTSWPHIHVVDLFSAFLDTPGIHHASNYTGKVLKPAPLVYDPLIMAQAVKASILHPKSTRYPGAASLLFKLSHAIAPELTTKLSGLLMKMYLKRAKKASSTDGNLFNTVNFAMCTNGNTKPHIKPGIRRLLKAGALLAGAGIAVYLIAGKKTSRHVR